MMPEFLRYCCEMEEFQEQFASSRSRIRLVLNNGWPVPWDFTSSRSRIRLVSEQWMGCSMGHPMNSVIHRGTPATHCVSRDTAW